MPEPKNRTDVYLNNVRQVGQEFSKGGISQQTKEKLNTPLLPREVFEEMGDAS